MSIDYRGLARNALHHARLELDGGDDRGLQFAALQLRMAIEALTYDRMQLYADDVPPSEYATWQPKRVMGLLLEVDANADKSSSLAVGTEGPGGAPPKEMVRMGTEKVLDMATIKGHYDALGSHLHIPTRKQMQEGWRFDAAKLRERCQRLVSELEAVLASPVWNLTLAVVARIDCAYCGKPIRKRAPDEGSHSQVKCFECNALYRVTSVDDEKVLWEPLQTEVACPTENCDHVMVLGNHEIEKGTNWKCPKCDHRYTIDLAVVPFVESKSC